MATKEQCAAALDRLAGRLAEISAADRAGNSFTRTVSCFVPDLRVTFLGRLVDSRLKDVASVDGRPGAAEPAQLRLTVSSDDLLSLVDGRLGFGAALASGRVKVGASFADLFRLRKLV